MIKAVLDQQRVRYIGYDPVVITFSDHFYFKVFTLTIFQPLSISSTVKFEDVVLYYLRHIDSIDSLRSKVSLKADSTFHSMAYLY